MLQVAIRQVHGEHVETLRAWLAQVNGVRRDEALATLRDEGVSHEMALLIEGKDGPVVVYVMEVEDPARARRAAEHSSHPIDADHQRVLQVVFGDMVASELLLDLHPTRLGPPETSVVPE